MHPIFRLFAVAVVFAIATISWLVLGGVMTERSRTMGYQLRGDVVELWGKAQSQAAPTFTFEWNTTRIEKRSEIRDGVWVSVEDPVIVEHVKAMQPSSTDIEVDLDLDQRLKGLMWYSLYDVDFGGTWTYVHAEEVPGTLAVSLQFPDMEGLYDSFVFAVDGEDLARTLKPVHGGVTARVPIEPGQTVTLDVGYVSRGMGEWRYVPSPDVANLEDFSLVMRTDFSRVDFPAFSMSPTSKRYSDEGWTLDWTFSRMVTGHDIGMIMPDRIQPGDLAAQLSFSAPISLLFFFGLLFVLSVMRRIEIHPINYLFLAASFFAFHLLFAYSVDHMHLVPAFVLCSVVSIVLVVSYLRLVVSPRFAFVEAAAAQLVYLIGFALAHFWDGFTGLTVTVLSILTLFILMQMTGRLNWSEVLRRAAVGARQSTAAVSEESEVGEEAGA